MRSAPSSVRRDSNPWPHLEMDRKDSADFIGRFSEEFYERIAVSGSQVYLFCRHFGSRNIHIAFRDGRQFLVSRLLLVELF